MEMYLQYWNDQILQSSCLQSIIMQLIMSMLGFVLLKKLYKFVKLLCQNVIMYCEVKLLWNYEDYEDYEDLQDFSQNCFMANFQYLCLGEYAPQSTSQGMHATVYMYSTILWLLRKLS